MVGRADVADRLEIRELMDRYGFAIDTLDWDLYRDVFTPGATIDYQDAGGSRLGVEATIQRLDPPLRAFAALQHNMTNHRCVVDGSSGRACTYFVAYHIAIPRPGEETVLRLGGFYQDRLVRTDRWRIDERVEKGVWMEGPYPSGVTGPAWLGSEKRWRPELPV